MNVLDYTNQEKKYMPVKLLDGTELSLRVPKKKLFVKLSYLEKSLKKTENIKNIYDDLTNLTVDILSNNKTCTLVSVETVNKLMDIEDMALLIGEYSKFAGEIVKSPN